MWQALEGVGDTEGQTLTALIAGLKSQLFLQWSTRPGIKRLEPQTVFNCPNKELRNTILIV